METLESRLHNLIKRQPASNQNQQYSQLANNNQSSIGAMIPTPGMSHSGNSNMMVTSSADTSLISSSGGITIRHDNVNNGTYCLTVVTM